MIQFTNKDRRNQALRLVSYLRAGKADARSVEDSYFVGQRWHHIYKQWRALRCYDSPEVGGMTREKIEVFYVRFCIQHCADHHVRLGEWKPILETIAARLQFFAANNLDISSLTVESLDRLVHIARALKYDV